MKVYCILLSQHIVVLLVYAVCLSYLSVHVMVVAVPGSHFFLGRDKEGNLPP